MSIKLHNKFQNKKKSKNSRKKSKKNIFKKNKNQKKTFCFIFLDILKSLSQLHIFSLSFPQPDTTLQNNYRAFNFVNCFIS